MANDSTVQSNFKYEYTARSANGKRHRKRRKRKQSFFNTFLFIVLSLVGVLLIFATVFKVEHIVVEGQSRYEHEKIIKLSGILLGDNMYNIDKDKVAFNIESGLNYVEDVEVRTRLFGTVVLVVNETKPSLAIQNGGTYILLSSKLKIIEMDVDILPTNIPMVHGVNVELPMVNTKLRFSEEDEVKKQVLLDILENLEQTELSGINKIDITEVLNIKMEYDNRVVILLGTKNKIKNKIENLKYIIDTQVEDKNYYCIETTFQESETPRSSIRPIVSLEDFYSGHEYISSNFYDEDESSESEDEENSNSETSSQTDTENGDKPQESSENYDNDTN